MRLNDRDIPVHEGHATYISQTLRTRRHHAMLRQRQQGGAFKWLTTIPGSGPK